MGDNLGFQGRWEIRRKEVNEDSSSDNDSKSNPEQVLKNQRLILEDDYHSDNPTQIEPEEGNTGTKTKSKFKKPRKKEQPGVTKRNKLVNEKAAHATVKKPRRRRKKNNGFAYDPSLMEDFKSFSESLLKDMKAAGEEMFVKMKDEMFELQSSGVSIANNRISKVGYAQVLNQRNIRYVHNQMPPGVEDSQIQGLLELNRNKFTMDNLNKLATRDNADAVFDYPLIQHQQGLLLGRGIPNTSLNRPFVIRESEVTRIPNMQHHLNSEPNVYRSRNIVNLEPSGRVDSNVNDVICQNSLRSFDSGMLPRNEARDQSPTRIARPTFERQIMEVERLRNYKAGVPFVNNGTRQLQVIMDERAAFHGNFPGPIMFRQGDNEQPVNDPKFNANFSSQIASSMYLTFPDETPNPYIRSQIIRPSSIQHKTSGNQAVMNEGFTRMKAEGSIQNGYLGIEQNNIRSIPQVDNSDHEQCSAPDCSTRHD